MLPSCSKVAAALALALLLPACGGSPRRFGQILFSESFDGAFPGAAWTAPAVTGSAGAAPDTGTGFPAPSLKMSTTGATATVRTTSVLTFNNPPLTISLTMADLSAAMTDAGTGTVRILDTTPAVVASASWDNTTGRITFHIAGAADATSAALAATGTFHRLVFVVSSGGAGSWSLDGAPALVSGAVPAGMLTLELGASFGGGAAWPSFFFDNVVVTSP